MKAKTKPEKKAAPKPQETTRPVEGPLEQARPAEEPKPLPQAPCARGLEYFRSHRALVILVTYAIVLYCALQHLGAVRGFFSALLAVIQPITVGFCIAFVLNVLLCFFEKTLLRVFDCRCMQRLRVLKRPLGVILALISALGIVALVALVVAPRLGESIRLMVSSIPRSTEELGEWLSDILSRTPIKPEQIQGVVEKINELSAQLIKWIETEYAVVAGKVLDVTSTMLNLVIDLLLSLIIAIYVLLQKERIGRAVRRLMQAYFPPKFCDRAFNVSSLSYRAFSNFVRGQLIEAVILGALCYVGMLLLRIPNAAVVSLLVGFTALIPVFGAWIGGGVSAFLILLADPGKVLLFIIFLLVLQQLEGNLIYPRVVGSAIGLPGLIVLCAVLVGGNLGGVMGMLMGVPVAAVVYELLRQGVARRTSDAANCPAEKT